MLTETGTGHRRQKENLREEALQRLSFCLEYPSYALLQNAERAGSVLKKGYRRAFGPFIHFMDFVTAAPIETIQELYTALFDLQPECCPYIGYHIFGDSHRRGLFLANLAAWYRSAGFAEEGRDLPDYLPTVMRFLAGVGKSQERQELLQYCVIPAMDRVERVLRTQRSPYRYVLAAARFVLNEKKGMGAS